MGTETTPYQPVRVTQADLEAKQARIACVACDNGRTPGSSTNNVGGPVDFIRYSWAFESKGIEINGDVLGAGQLIGPTTGWTPQFTDNTGQNGKAGTDLTRWVPYLNSVIAQTGKPDKTCAAFARYPATTWRAVKITSVDPCIEFGIWNLCRLDVEGDYKVYPVLDEETIVKIWCREVEEKGELRLEWYDLDEDTGEFVEAEWPTWQPYQGAPPEPIPYDCFIPCDQKFENFIAEGAVSDCNNYDVQFLCIFDGEPLADLSNQLEQVAVYQWDCADGRTTEIYTLADYNASLLPNADPLDPTTGQYTVPTSGVLANCDGSAFEEPPLPEPEQSNETCDYELTSEVCYELPIAPGTPYTREVTISNLDVARGPLFPAGGSNNMPWNNGPVFQMDGADGAPAYNTYELVALKLFGDVAAVNSQPTQIRSNSATFTGSLVNPVDVRADQLIEFDFTPGQIFTNTGTDGAGALPMRLDPVGITGQMGYTTQPAPTDNQMSAGAGTAGQEVYGELVIRLQVGERVTVKEYTCISTGERRLYRSNADGTTTLIDAPPLDWTLVDCEDEPPPTVVGYVPYCITDPGNADETLKAFRFFNSDGTFGERMLLTDIDPDAVDCC